MSSHCIYLGIDFSKEKFDFHGADTRGTLANTPADHRRFLAKLTPGTHLVCESTGSCHRALVTAAHAAGFALTVANPRQVRDFANGLGRRAKTDPIDALSLYDFGRLVEPKADLAPSPTQMALQELVVARQQAVLERSTLLVQVTSHSVALIATLHRARIALLTRHIAKLEAALTITLAQEESLAAQAARLAQVKGVGLLTATTALALCPELGTLNRGQAASLLGVAPFNHDSGPLQGQRHIAGGRYRLRCAIYMAALSAVRFNPILRAFYLQLRARGKAAKVALTAVMRKLFLLLNHLLKNPKFVLAT
jgi:transposase